MAAGFLEKFSAGRVQVASAGSNPTDQLNQVVIEAMNEVDIDLAARTPNRLNAAMVTEADYVITMGCGDACPIYHGKHYLDWVLDDPAGQGIAAVRLIRDEIAQRVRKLLYEIEVS